DAAPPPRPSGTARNRGRERGSAPRRRSARRSPRKAAACAPRAPRSELPEAAPPAPRSTPRPAAANKTGRPRNVSASCCPVLWPNLRAMPSATRKRLVFRGVRGSGDAQHGDGAVVGRGPPPAEALHVLEDRLDQRGRIQVRQAPH